VRKTSALALTVVLAGCATSPLPSSSATASTIVLPVPVREKAIAEEAEAVFGNRLKALGIGNFTASIGDDMRFTFVMPPSVDPADVNAVLHTAGVVEWLAWPDGTPAPNVGDAVPDGVLPLFDMASEIRSVTVTSTPTNGRPAGVEVTLSPAATQALSTYTTMHVNEPLPLALDGQLVAVPIIMSPITAGDLFITTGGSGSEPGSLSAAALGAILKSGPLPPAWSLR
jgi:hypothetical protein